MSAVRRAFALGVALSTVVVGLAVPQVAQAATPVPTAAVVPAADPVPDQYIVTLDGRTAKAEVSGEAEQLADRYDAGVLDVYDTALVGFSARMSPDDAQRLAADPRVALVEQDGYVQASATQSTPGGLWGLDRIDQRDLPVDGSYTYTTAAANVHAYVLDTGLYLSHSDFAGRVDPGVDFVDGGTPADCSGHGTHVTGTLGGTTYGVAKQVQIVPVRVLDCGGQGTFSNVIAGVNWVTANAIRPAVANMSLGGTLSQSLDNAIDASIDSGVTYTVAAGNNREDACLSSPGDDGRAIVVGASTQTDTRAEFSNWGPCVDLFAPGDRILSDYLGGGTATASGTSMAAPHVAGAAALYLAAHPTASVNEVVSALACTATIGHVSDPVGSLNVLLYTGDLTATAPLLPCTPVPDPPESGIGTVHLSWQTAVGAVPIQQFKIYRGTSSGAETLLRTIPGTTSSFNDITGAAGTWFYRITAVDPRGESPPSTEVAGTATAPELSATPLPLAVHLEWTNAPDAGPLITRFDVFQGNSPNPTGIIASLSPTQTTFDVQLPGPATQRFFVVKAVKPGPLGQVSTPSNDVAVTPQPGGPPGAPGLSTSARNKRAILSWTVPPSNNGTGAIGTYKVLRGSTSGGEVVVATVPGTQTSYSDTPLANGTAYYYTVVASTTAFGDGSASNEQVVVPSAVDVAFLSPSASVELRRVDGDAPGPALGFGGGGTSNPSVVSNTNGTFVFVRGGDNRLYWQRSLNGIPQGWNAIAGTLTSDPIAVADGTNISIFVRGGDNAVYRQLMVGLNPQGWLGLGGGATSNIAAAVSGTTTLVFVRGGDNALFVQRILNSAPQGWSSLGGLATSDPAAALDAFLGVTVFVRGLDNALYRQHVSLSGTPGGWTTLGGNVTSNPSAVFDGGGVHVAVRGADNAVWSQRLVSLTSAPGWASLGGSANADPALAAGSGHVWAIARSSGNGLYWQEIQPSVSGWQALGGESSTKPSAASVP